MVGDGMTILEDVRSAVGLDQKDKAFDVDLLIYMNSGLSSLAQQGVTTMEITEDTEWVELIPQKYVTSELSGLLKEYLVLHTRILFDPPPQKTQAYMEGRLRENEWRIQILIEQTNEGVK